MYFFSQIVKSHALLLKSNLVNPEARSESTPVTPTQESKNKIDYSKLSPEQKTLVQSIEEKIAELEAKLGALNAGEKVTGVAVQRLEVGLKGTDTDPDAEPTKKLLETYKRRLKDILAQKEFTLADLSKLQAELSNSISKVSIEKETKRETIDLTKINNREFLSLPAGERLQYITKGNIASQKIASGEVGEVSFTFTFDGKVNKELYMLTTAGQVLPAEVAEVTVGGVKFSRNGLSGEFFNSANKRLTIHEGTKLEITGLRSADEVAKLQKDQSEQVLAYGDKDPAANPEIVSEAVKRGIDPKFANLVFKDGLEKMPVNQRKVALEEMFTEFDRTRGRFGNDLAMKDGKYDERLSFSLLRQFIGKGWKEKASQIGYTKERLERDTVYEAKGEGHKQYEAVINNLASQYDVPADKIIQLIYHENARWNPQIKAPGSSAYGLGQMIDGTWKIYGKGLDRNNPFDQLEATTKYMRDIYDRQGCSWEEVLAFYNTGEGIKGLGADTIADYVRKNDVIAEKARKALGRNPQNAQEYFTAAVAYYNDMKYNDVA